MAVLQVLKVTNPKESKILQEHSVDVLSFDAELGVLVGSMIETMYAANGVGLAAPQVGRNLNIFVMRTVAGLQENRQEHIVLINPYTVIEVGEKTVDQEGCLSIPGLVGDVERFPMVGCVYQDVDGNRRNDVFQNFQARVYQHEFDHLEGVLYPDRAEKMYRVKKQCQNG
jgi:peptide deformylase